MIEHMQRVGFIGLGTMGLPMAKNLLREGYQLMVYDLNVGAAEELVRGGAQKTGSPSSVAAGSDTVITMLPDGPDVEKVVLGSGGVIEGIQPGSVLIDMSTIDPATTERVGEALAAHEAHMIDSPVGKTAEHAVTGTLTLMVGGNPEIVERCRPILSCVGEDIFYCGELGTGQAMKLVNNFLAAATLAASVEAVVLGTKAGLQLDTMLRVMRTTMASNSQLMDGLPKKAFADDFAPGFKIELALKDVSLAVGLAERLRVDSPVGRSTLVTLTEAREQGLSTQDVGALLLLRERAAEIRVRTDNL